MKTVGNLILLAVTFLSLVVILASCSDAPKDQTQSGSKKPTENIPNQPTQPFPLIGKTYQLDRAKYPDDIPICVTAESMKTYMKAFWDKDVLSASKLLREVKDPDDIEALKASEGCTLISSFSQAKIIKKGMGVHQAEFFAFPFLPMWGHYEYFGGIVS